jgi:hypothetical protein
MQYDPIAEVSLKLNYLHFRTISGVSYNNGSSTWFGDEIDLLVDLKLKNNLKVFIHGGIFIANDAYKGIENHPVNAGLIGELSLGLEIKY